MESTTIPATTIKQNPPSPSDEFVQHANETNIAKLQPKPKPEFPVARPTDVRFYAQGGYDFLRVIGGVPDGVYLNSLTNNGDGTYTASVGGLSGGDASGRPSGSFGLVFQGWRRVEDSDYPGQIFYDDDGPRLIVDATFAQYDTNDYAQQLTLSTQQAEALFGSMIDVSIDSLTDAYNGDPSGVFTLEDTINAMIDAYDASGDAVFETIITEREVFYYNVGLMITGGDERDINRSKIISFPGGIQAGAGASFMGFGGSHFVGIYLPHIEASVVRANWRGMQADWVFNAGANLFIGYDPEHFFQEDFWDDDRVMGGVYLGTGLRFTTNLFQTRDVPKAVRDAANGLYDHGYELSLDDLNF